MNHRIRLAHRIAIDGIDIPHIEDAEESSYWQRHCRALSNGILKSTREGKCQSIVCNNVADMYVSSPKEDWSADSFPNCIPPFEDCIFEYTTKNGLQVGSFVRCRKVDDKVTSEAISSITKIHDLHGSQKALLNSIIEGRAAFIVRMNSLAVPDGYGTCVIQPMDWCETLTADGTIIEQWWQIPKSLSNIADGAISQIAHHVAHLTISFMSCKNVSTVDAPPEMLPDAKWQRRQAGKIKGLTFKTLKIDGLGSGPRSPSGEPTGAHNSFHICRANFAEYTAEKPLFGKYVGRFWRPSHVKGSKEVGIVEKDYSIEPADRSFDASTDGH